jgi:hypothetical protein
MSRGRPRQAQTCCSAKCRREIQPWEKGVAVTLFAQTLGMGKRRTSKSERLHLCPQCAFRVASETQPSKTAPVDLAFFRILLDIAGLDPAVAEATFEQLSQRRQELLYPHALPEPEILPPAKALKAAV